VTWVEWVAVGCALVSFTGIVAILVGRWQPRSRLVLVALFVALGLAVGAAVGRLMEFSIPVFLGLLELYVVGSWIRRRRARRG
jgi:hypothetical protein